MMWHGSPTPLLAPGTVSDVITSDSPFTNVYRVNVHFVQSQGVRGVAAVNVKASSPARAQEWLLCYPHKAGLYSTSYMKVLSCYKLRKQPVWLKKLGTNGYRFDLRKIEGV